MIRIDVSDYLQGLEDLFDAASMTAPGRDRAHVGLAIAARTLRPNRPMHPADWGEENLRLDAQTSERDGRIKFTVYQRAWLGSMVTPGVSEIYVKTCPRAGKSLTVAVGMHYAAVHEGQNSIFWERTDAMAQTFHDEKLYPLLKSPGVAPFVRSDTREGTQDKWTDRYFLNGAAQHCRSASTPDGMRQIPGRWLFCDEISAPQWRDGKGGNKVDTVSSRGRQYIDSKVIATSTPGDDDCAITAGYLRGNQCQLHLPCPHCGTTQILRKLVGPDGQKEGPGFKYLLDPATRQVSEVWYLCENEACVGAPGAGRTRRIYETDKAWMMDRAEYLPTAVPERPDIVSFDLWSAHVFDPKATWRHMCVAHLESVNDPSKRRTFKTDWLAERWETANVTAISTEDLEERAEPYPAEVPDGVRVIIWGQDAQKGQDATPEEGGKPPRIEYVAWGFGYGEECWALGRWVIDGDPFSPESNKLLLELYQRQWMKADGTAMLALAGIPDVNHRMQDALNFYGSYEIQELMQRLSIQIWPAVGGNETAGSTNPLISLKQKATNVATGRSYLRLNTQKGKEALYNRLRLTGSGPQVIHWPKSAKGTGFVKSLNGISRKRNEKGILVYPDKDANEVADCWVYAYAALQLAKDMWPEVMSAITREAPPERLPYRLDDRSAQAPRGVIERRLIAPRRAAVGVAPVPDPAAKPGGDAPISVTVTRSPRVIRSSVMG